MVAKSLTLTLVIRSPTYYRLLSELTAFKDPRARAGWLKRLGEEGARLSSGNGAGTVTPLRHLRIATSPEEGATPIDIRVVIQPEEFPFLYAALMQVANRRARAALFRRLAEDALRTDQRENAEPNLSRVQAVAKETSDTVRSDLNSLSLPVGSVPDNLFDGFAGGAGMG